MLINLFVLLGLSVAVTGTGRKDRMIKEQQTFFEKKADNYHDLIKQRRNRAGLSRFIIPHMGISHLDVGNGGVKDFSSPNTTRYVGLDFSLAMLRKGDEDMAKVCGDAMILPFNKNVFDSLMYSSMLHHLTKKRFGDTQRRIIAALTEGYRCLKEGGNIIVIEPCMNRASEKLERAVFFLIKTFFNLFGIPEVFLFSSKTIVRAMERAGFKEITITTGDKDIKDKWRWVSPVIGLPGFKIPRILLPVKVTLIEGKK